MKDSTSKNLQTKIFKLFDDKQYDEDLEALKKTHRKEYLKQKHQEYKLKWKKETIRFTHEEFKELDEIASRYGYKRSPFLKACIFAYINDSYITPDNSQIKSFENSINEISQSINESVRYIHLNQAIKLEDVEAIKIQIHQLELAITNTLREPPNLKEWLVFQMKNDDRFISKLKETLNELNYDNQDP